MDALRYDVVAHISTSTSTNTNISAPATAHLSALAVEGAQTAGALHETHPPEKRSYPSASASLLSAVALDGIPTWRDHDKTTLLFQVYLLALFYSSSFDLIFCNVTIHEIDGSNFRHRSTKQRTPHSRPELNDVNQSSTLGSQNRDPARVTM
jgi:hypothetical protein